jgi:RNA polymerase sigma-70 factor (ECF subfamily)
MSIVLSSLPDALACAVAKADDSAPRRSLPRMIEPPTAPPPDDREIIDARLMTLVAAGDKQAFGELYDRLSAPLYATALRIVRDALEAQDIMHDAFVALWEKAGSFDRGRGTVFSWAVTLVRNRAVDRIRMRRRRAELLAASTPGDIGYDEECGHTAASDAAVASESALAVRAAVAALPPDQQRALELAFFGGLTQEQIARKLDAPLGTVKARIRRGLMKLRDSLALRS